MLFSLYSGARRITSENKNWSKHLQQQQEDKVTGRKSANKTIIHNWFLIEMGLKVVGWYDGNLETVFAFGSI